MGVVLDEKRIIFLRASKTAQTTISNELIQGSDKGVSLTSTYGYGNQTWKEVMNAVSLYQWSTYTIVASIRNPWDQMYDAYKHGQLLRKARGDEEPGEEYSFYDWLSRHGYKKSQGYYLFDGPICQVDKVIRFENLYEDAKNVLGIDITKHLNPSPKVNYRDYYDRFTKGYVDWLCSREIKEFGYEY